MAVDSGVKCAARGFHGRLNDPATLRLARKMIVYTPGGPEITALAERARQLLPMIAEPTTVHRIASFNPDSVWAIARKDRFDICAPSGEGFVGFLMLNAEGERRVRAGTFNGIDPDLALLTGQHETPAAIYFWIAFAPGHLAAGVPLALQKIWTPLYRDVDIYSRSINPTAVRFVEGLGFRKHIELDGTDVEHLYVYKRAPSPRPSYDNHVPSRGGISVRTARTLEDMAQVIAMRGAVYMSEQRCPYDEEFDGNDLAATHLIAMADDEPSGCIRMRFFADFAKIERLLVRQEFRVRDIAATLANAAIELCRMKGYGRICGHSARHMIDFWKRFDMHLAGNAEGFAMSDFEYFQMAGNFSPHPDAVKFGSSPYVVLRPEGAWDRPGALDRSAARPITSPSIQ